MRIVYLTETWPPEVNGVAATVERSVRHLRRSGHAVLLVRPRQAGEAAGANRTEWRTAGLAIPMYPELRIGLAWPAALRRRVEDFEADLVHVATPGPLGRAGMAAARALGLPATSDFRTNFHLYAPHYGFDAAARWVQRYLRDLHNRGDATFVPTRETALELEAAGYERVEVVGRGVDALRFSPLRRRRDLRQRWGADADAPVFAYVGRLAPEKNAALALRAWEAVRAQRPDARMVVVGDGPSKAKLQAAHPQAIFAGTQRDEALAAHYASADVFLFPSLSETFGNVTLEAMASGLAVVAYRRAAAGALIRDGRNGLLAEPGDEGAFVAAALRAVTDDAEALRQRARQTALAHDWEPVLRRFEHRLDCIAGATSLQARMSPA